MTAVDLASNCSCSLTARYFEFEVDVLVACRVDETLLNLTFTALDSCSSIETTPPVLSAWFDPEAVFLFLVSVPLLPH